MPSSRLTYSSATTRGRWAGAARSVARARPAVCVVCRPAPSSRKRKGGAGMAHPGRAFTVSGEHQHAQRAGWPGRQTASACQTRCRAPGASPAPRHGGRCGGRSSARSGANRMGRATISETTQAGHGQLDDHHAVERAVEQRQRHAHRDLEQRQPQQLAAAAARGVAASANGRKRGAEPRPARMAPPGAAGQHVQERRHARPARCRSRWPRVRARGLPAVQRRLGGRRSVSQRQALRHDGRASGHRAGRAAHRVHGGQQPGCAGRTVNSIDARQRGAQAASTRRARRRPRSGSASPSPPRGRTRPAPGPACRPRRKSIAAPPSVAGTRSRASCTSVGDRSMASTWAPRPRGFHRQRAGASSRRPARAGRAGRPGSHDSSVARMRSRPARTVARMRLTGRVRGQPLPGLGGRCGRSRSRSRRGALVGGRAQVHGRVSMSGGWGRAGWGRSGRWRRAGGRAQS